LDRHREDIIEDLKRGVPKTRVAKRYGSTPFNLAKWLKERGLNPRPPEDEEED
jgi:hypothetical protein